MRLLGPADDIDAEMDLRHRAFGPIPAGERASWVDGLRHSIGAGELLGAFDGSRLVGSARYHAMRQWWRGRPVPMAGVAGVKVAPEDRGRGIGRALMSGLIAEISGRGYPVSALFPATVPLYRSLGWEFAGAYYETTVPIGALAELIGPDQLVTDWPPAAAPGLRRAVAADAALVVETLGRIYRARRDSGPAVHEPAAVARWLDDEDHFAYLADDGFLSYRWSRDTDSVRVQLLAAASPPTARAFWQIVASHGTMVGTVRARLAPDDPVSRLTREPVAVTAESESWMLRLIDAAAAVEARAFPAAVTLSVQLEIADEVLPANSGQWHLEISGGTGRLTPDAGNGGREVVRLGARGLAALYGGVPLSTLRGAGLAAGDQAADDALDGAFGGRPAFMLHEF